jgi:hypothetical protein
MHIGFWCESQKKRDHYEDLDVGGRKMGHKECEDVRTGLIWPKIAISRELLLIR